MIRYILYFTYNLIYQLVSFFFYLYANTFLNEAIVPENLMWKNNKPRTDLVGLGGVAVIKTLALFIEAIILILVIYFINKFYLYYTFKEDYPNRALKRTTITNIILSFCFITILIWGSFRGFLW